MCEKHFSEEFISREETFINSDGSTVSVERNIPKPKLSNDAYPSIFKRTDSIAVTAKAKEKYSCVRDVSSYLTLPPPLLTGSYRLLKIKLEAIFFHIF